MTATFDFDRLLESVLRAGGPQSVPSSLVEAALTEARALPQRRPLVPALDRRVWPARRLLPPHQATARLAVVGLVILLTLALIAAAIGIGSRLLRAEVPESPVPTQQAEAVAAGVWTATRSMAEAREGHTATLLPDGRVLVAGGGIINAASSELYDPDTGSWSATGDMTVARGGHTATLLPDGKVLVVGGNDGNNAIASAELYDPGTGTWTTTPAMIEGHGSGHTATLLPDGRVLVAGGDQGGEMPAAAELYDPASGTWTATGSMMRGRMYHAATLIPDGTVLVAGSLHSVSSAELYHPVTGTWTATGSMAIGRHDFTATLLMDGTVLVTAYEGSKSAELYDPSTGTWSATGSMIDVHLGSHTATLLPDGTVLVAGGAPNRPLRAERYDPRTRAWAAAPDTGAARQYGTATLLPNGTVLVAGGRVGSASVELYDPSVEP
jgi:hypothetical protein